MPMSLDDFEHVLSQLNDPELDTTARNDLLISIRADKTEHVDEAKALTEKNEKLKSVNEDVLAANSKMFRQLGYTADNDRKEEIQKTFSETVNVSDIMKGADL